MKSFLNYSKNRILYNICRMLFVFLMVFLVSKCEVKAEVPTGEQYSEFATNKTLLLTLYTSTSSVNFYAYNPQLAQFKNGSLSLVRYEDNSNDVYSNWSIRVYETPITSGSYTLNWTAQFINEEVATAFCGKITNPTVTDSVRNSFTCFTNSNSSFFTINFTTSFAQAEEKVDFTFANEGMSINWFLRLATFVGYPQIIPSQPVMDNETLQEQQQIIINQNQTIIDQNNQTNNKLDDIKNQNEKAEETRKGIWESIKELPNKFLDMLKSLFIPSDDFFEEFINTFMTTLKEKLGFLLYPFEVFIDIINRFLDIPEGDGIIHIPQINDPVYNHKLIEQQDFDIGAIFKTGKIGELHNIYLIFIDFYIIIKLINLALKKFNATFGGGVTE